MSGIITKIHDFSPPEIVDGRGLQGRFGDIALIRDHGETVRIFLCREMASGDMEPSGLFIMPRGGFIRSLGWAATQFLWTKH